MPVPVPTPSTRWRCTLCGNLTRFDVERRTHVREFVHVDLAGGAEVEQREVLSEEIEHVSCRWCRQVDTVELVARPQHEARPQREVRPRHEAQPHESAQPAGSS